MAARLEQSLQSNQVRLKSVFQDCADVQFRPLRRGDQVHALLVFIEGMVSLASINAEALQALLSESDPAELADRIASAALPAADVSHTDTVEGVADAVARGKAVLLADGLAQALVLKTEDTHERSVEEPPSETSIRGPRDGFTEHIQTNTALVRRRLRSPNLKMKSFIIGEQSRTKVMLAYLEGIADPKPVAEAEQKLKAIKIDGVLESGYLEEFLESFPWSPFPELQYSERPDTVAAQLLEGRFAIFTDGTPFVLSGPATFWQLLQASEDYYERFPVSTAIRWLRFLFASVALYLPALYVALVTFHQDMLPTNLLISIAAAREPIPFPVLMETLLMEVAFEALREAGIRLPKTLGQTVSILGALVIGTAAVQAGIVSAPMVIIVSMTGIASFTIPRFNAAIAIRMLRFPLIILAGGFGLFGVVFGTVMIALHMCSLTSFGVPYLAPVAPLRPGRLKDVVVRAPWWAMLFRPAQSIPQNRRRMPKGQGPAQS